MIFLITIFVSRTRSFSRLSSTEVSVSGILDSEEENMTIVCHDCIFSVQYSFVLIWRKVSNFPITSRMKVTASDPSEGFVKPNTTSLRKTEIRKILWTEHWLLKTGCKYNEGLPFKQSSWCSMCTDARAKSWLSTLWRNADEWVYSNLRRNTNNSLVSCDKNTRVE